MPLPSNLGSGLGLWAGVEGTPEDWGTSLLTLAKPSEQRKPGFLYLILCPHGGTSRGPGAKVKNSPFTEEIKITYNYL